MKKRLDRSVWGITRAINGQEPELISEMGANGYGEPQRYLLFAAKIQATQYAQRLRKWKLRGPNPPVFRVVQVRETLEVDLP